MSTTPPSDPKDAAKKELSGAVVWALLAAAFAVGMFAYSGKVDAEKRGFYYVAGAIGAILAAVNGYGAWVAYNKSKPK